MQVLTDAFDVGYLSNTHCRWLGSPALADRLLRPLARKQPSNYQSIHGRTKQPSDPAECGLWWYRFFRREPPYVTRDDVSDRKMRAFCHSIAALQHVMQRPLMFKNLYASLRIDPIAAYIPNPLFVIVERGVLDNAQSILKGRMDARGSYEAWWSVPPPNVGYLQTLPPAQQVVEQIRSIHALIQRDIERLELEHQTLRIRYEDFCHDVYGTLSRFEAFARDNRIPLQRRFEVPANFTVSRSRKIPEAIFSEIEEYVLHTEHRNG